jgi:hypothetical protein
LGFNFRPTEITGFLGLSQLKLLEQNIKIREQNYLLIEKTSNKDNTEKITNLYSCSNLSDVYRISNGKTIYDYTGIVKPIIHENLKVYLFDEYVNSKK